jgi:hypothetical protein
MTILEIKQEIELIKLRFIQDTSMSIIEKGQLTIALVVLQDLLIKRLGESMVRLAKHVERMAA